MESEADDIFPEAIRFFVPDAHGPSCSLTAGSFWCARFFVLAGVHFVPCPWLVWLVGLSEVCCIC